MDKEILKKVLEHIEQFGSDQLLILSGVFVGMLFINLAQAIYTSRAVDKYKNELKKKELKFSVYNQIQIEKLSELFELAHELKCSTSPIVVLIKKSLDKVTDLNDLDDSYELLKNCYSKNRYIFPKKIKSHFEKSMPTVSDFKFNILFLIEKNAILSSNEEEDRIHNLELIKREIGDYEFKKGSLEVMLFCERLKVLIEEHFEEWE